ncbi:MAG TPA: LysR substrate-binding domain-containing protein [Ramlibacter sp.]|uniref:LysR substrate-binding domain-containing protein n=1 Tax=Ramlibacter sp. TaxID=1917967 RepID=UPI002D8052D6|nr:LysR substrate-binding domain-containing protein [Ramlibacter sp.]HET8745779.1 LysR substrate-binding domain-containing protein [Ramlibacter sp.]
MPPGNIGRYLRHGTLPQLRVFEASVRLGCFARAAEELHMAPPTVSVQIRKLTETVGAPLFEQVGRRIYPTETGRRLHASCEDVFRALADFEATLGQLRGLQGGQLRIAACTTARHFLPRLLGAFVQHHPAIETALQIHNRAGLLQRLAANEDDLYLFADAPRERELVVQTVLANPLVVFARADHPLAGAQAIPLARIAAEPFLVREPGSGTRDAALAAFARAHLVPRIRMELGSNEAIREAILAGAGVAVLPRHLFGAQPEAPGLVCLDVQGFPLESRWQFAWPVGKRIAPAARAFLDFARAHADALVHGTPVPARLQEVEVHAS